MKTQNKNLVPRIEDLERRVAFLEETLICVPENTRGKGLIRFHVWVDKLLSRVGL
jgi:hypothetical protein